MQLAATVQGVIKFTAGMLITVGVLTITDAARGEIKPPHGALTA
jgi:hypothetical protein